MSKHDQVACPRCGALFECKTGSYFICHCSDINLTPEQTEYLAENWDDCLCHKCLVDITTSWETISSPEN